MAEAADAGRERRRIPTRIIVIVIAAVVVIGLVWLIIAKREGRSRDAFTGYVVSDNIYMSSPVAGTLASVAVRRGQRVAAGEPLFRVDPTVRAAEAERARAQISANEAAVQQQQSALARARAELAVSQAEADRSDSELKRMIAAQREKQGSVAELQVEQAQAAYQSALRRRDSANMQVNSAVAGIEAARAQAREAQAGLTSAQRQLSELSPTAPRAGRIEDIMFKEGETVSPNVAIVSIVPDGEVKVRFYVPQRKVNAYQPGRRVVIACDGCVTGMSAVIDFVATEPEYTPPIIYSLDAREKLVFLLEAVPSNPGALIPGQPIDVADTADELPER